MAASFFHDWTVFRHMLSYLDVRTLLHSTQFASKWFYEVTPTLFEVLDPFLFMEICASERYSSLSHFKDMFAEKYLEFALRCARLRTVWFSNFRNINNRSLSCFLRANGSNLNALRLSRCSALQSQDIARIVCACPNLKQLNLKHCKNSVTDIALASVSRVCKRLQVLELAGCAKITDVGVCSIAEGLSRTLIHINLNGCFRVTNKGARTLALKCNKTLETFHLRWCPKITDNTIAEIVKCCGNILQMTPAAQFNVSLSRLCQIDLNRAQQLRVNVRCGRCAIYLFKNLPASKVVIGKGSQSHLCNEVYTNCEPSNRLLKDVSHDFRIDFPHQTMFNCPKNCHLRGVEKLWLVDAGSGIIDRRGHKYAIACGHGYGQIEYIRMIESDSKEIAFACGRRHDGLLTSALLPTESSMSKCSEDSLDPRASSDCTSCFFNRKAYQIRRCKQVYFTNSYSAYYGDFFKAAGKLPNKPCLLAMEKLIQDYRFTGCIDDYVDGNGSTIFMYCLGPAEKDSVAMMQLLVRYGAQPCHINDKRQSAVGYAKAWRRNDSPIKHDLYDKILRLLEDWGCDMSEEPAF